MFCCASAKKSNPILLAKAINANTGNPTNTTGNTTGNIMHCIQNMGVLIICFSSFDKYAIFEFCGLKSSGFSLTSIILSFIDPFIVACHYIVTNYTFCCKNYNIN